MKRIFIAIKIEADQRLLEMISSFKKGLKEDSVKWTEPENLHITLAFLGDTHEGKINSISSMLTEKCSGSGKFDMVLKGAGLFKNIKDPRIIWTAIEPSGKLTDLYSSVMGGLKDLDINIEERHFKPHLTLGRVRSIKNTEILKSLIAMYQDTEIQKTEVSEVILYESILKQSGAVYKVIAKCSLDQRSVSLF